MDKLERYARQTMLAEIGEEGQRVLAGKKVLVVGVGGLGSAAAIYLAGAGVGTIALLDPDTVSISNLQRQVLYEQSQTGMEKAEMAAARLRALNPDISVISCAQSLTAENAADAVSGFDLVLDCTDNYATRYAIDDGCAARGVPWVYGSIGEFQGQLSLFNGPSGTRYTDLYPDREALTSAPRRTLGVLGAVAGVIGAMQAAEAVKYLLGFGRTLDARLFCIDLLTMHTTLLDI